MENLFHQDFGFGARNESARIHTKIKMPELRAANGIGEGRSRDDQAHRTAGRDDHVGIERQFAVSDRPGPWNVEERGDDVVRSAARVHYPAGLERVGELPYDLS